MFLFFQNIIIQERHFFMNSLLVFLRLKMAIIYRVLCPEHFCPYCQLTHYSHLLKHHLQFCFFSFYYAMQGHLQLMIFSYFGITMTTGFGQIVQKSFAVYLFLRSTLPPLARMMGQSFLDYLNLLHAQGVTLEDAGIVQMNRV